MAKKPTTPPPIALTPALKDVSLLDFDDENPRLVSADGTSTQEAILKTLWSEFAVAEIAMSIAANGYFNYEPLFAIESGKRFKVIEGNRRLAAVKILRDSDARKKVGATDLPSITAAAKATLKQLPVIVCKREDVWQYLGFKHVNGPQDWSSEAKAAYIARVHNEWGIPLQNIAQTIGDTNDTVIRLYRAKMVLEQATGEGEFETDDRWKKHFSFSHLYTGLGYEGIRDYIGLKQDAPVKSEPIKGKENMVRLGELLTWMYGSKSRNQEPVVKTQNPDLRILDEVLQSKDGVVALKRGLPLPVARDIARGDEALFRESLQSSKQALQRAIGTLTTGFTGQPDLMRTGTEIHDLAEKLYYEMNSIKPKRSGRS